jgi:hypothetical protein
MTKRTIQPAASTFLGEKPFAPGQNSTSYIAEFIK